MLSRMLRIIYMSNVCVSEIQNEGMKSVLDLKLSVGENLMLYEKMGSMNRLLATSYH